MSDPLVYDTRAISSYGIRILWLLFTLFIFYGALIPFDFSLQSEFVISNVDKINWTPFVDPDGSRASIPDVVQNILFFLPFGFLGLLSFSRYKFFALFLVVFFGFVISLNIELLQLTTRNRTTSVTDLICNTVGTAVGALIALVAFGIFSGLMRFTYFQRVFHNKHYYLFVIALFVVAAGSLQPFDFTLDVGIVWTKVSAMLHSPVLFTAQLSDELVVGFRFFLFGLITAYWLRSIGNMLWPLAGIFLSASVGILFEFAQLIVVSRAPTAQDIAVILVGCALGGLFALAAPHKISLKFWALPAIIITGIAATVQTLAPFEFSNQHNVMNLFPFLHYYGDSTFNAIANFLETLLIYFPLGFILQFVFSNRKSAFIFIILIVGAMAYSLEYCQGWVVGRYPDITDVIAGVLGAVIAGSLCLRWSRVFHDQGELGAAEVVKN